MRMLKRAVFVLSCLVILPASASAQTALAGIVKDSSGGVLPGVTVEASSSSLIEKTRATVTDASGQYRLPELTPGHLHALVHVWPDSPRSSARTST